MSDIKLVISNADKIASAFRRAPSLVRRQLPDAINRSLLTIGAEAAQNAPVRTGNLRSSILDPDRGLTLADNSVFEGSVGSGTGYGGFVESGTRFMQAQPFLAPAVSSTHSTVQDFFTQMLNNVLLEIGRST